MAIPFYNQADQDIYASGDKFIPQEQYRLNYTPSSIANAATTGITNTQAASPYIWPPQRGGGDGGGFSNTNKYGLDLDTQKTITVGSWEQGGPGNQYGSYVPTTINIAQSEGGIWKNVDTNQNVYHANIDYQGVIGSVADKIMGKEITPGVPEVGSTTGTEWDEDFDPTIAGQKLNVIQRWREKKAFKAEQEQAVQDAREKAATQHTYAGGDPSLNQGDGGAYSGQGDTPGSESFRGSDEIATDAASYDLAKGGRIGYADRGFVDEDINIEGPGFDINEQTAGFIDPDDAMNDFSWEIFNKPFDSLTDKEKGILYDLANEQASAGQDQGLASLV